MGEGGGIGRFLRAPARAWRLLSGGADQLDQAATAGKRAAKVGSEVLSSTRSLQKGVTSVDEDVRALQDEVRDLRRELHDRMLQYHLQLGRLSRAVRRPDERPADETVRLSGRAVPVAAGAGIAPTWEQIEGTEAPDPRGVEWTSLDACPVCGHGERTVVCRWNKLILLAKAPDDESARYDYAVCHACGVLYASRRPHGHRYRFLLAHFGEVTAKRGEGRDITNPVLYPYPLNDEQRAELRRLAARGVFVSDHLGLRSTEYLPGLLRDRFENSVHIDLLGSLLDLRGARVLEVRSRVGTILDGLRRAYGATVAAMPIWESQQLLLREVYGIESSPLIDFDAFDIPFDGQFDLIVCNHMLTHVLRPTEFFACLRRHLTPGGHLYLHNEPDDAEFLRGKQSMLATLNPLHLQAFDQRSLGRALAANGFEVIFTKSRNLNHMCLARRRDHTFQPMSEPERDARLAAHEAAYDRAVLGVDEHLRPRLAAEWDQAITRGMAAGIVEFDESGRLRLVGR